ncbi:transmembrane protein [Senna tora]|uniref:Transmembrane protein n=1 Tax=Senna tora TaxID=362788 RepID=A0A834TFG0_9FABA|nr:transmembrane protein [Senna tora]
MAQQRQSGMERIGVRPSHDLQNANGTADHAFIGVHGSTAHKHPRHRRSARSDRTRKLIPGLIMLFLLLVLGVTVLAYYHLSTDVLTESFTMIAELNKDNDDNDDLKSDSDFLTNVPRIERSRVLEFGRGSVGHGRDSRYWDRDDRRRDGDYNEDVVEKINKDENIGKDNASVKINSDSRSSNADSHKGLERKGVGLYNEAGRHELKMYEAAYEASLKNGVNFTEDDGKVPYDANQEKRNAAIDIDDEYDDFSDSHDARVEDDGDTRNIKEKHSNSDILKANNEVREASLNSFDTRIKDDNVFESAEGVSSNKKNFHFAKTNSQQISQGDSQLMKKSHPETKKKRRRRKFSGNVYDCYGTMGSCEMKLLNSTSQLVEPLESRKFVRFNLQYTETEEKPLGEEQWVPRFAGHQSLEEREKSFLAQDQKIKCGFVQGPEGSPSTGFDLTEDDASYISRCHIAVISCIFGNSDRLRVPATKTVTRISRKNVCFVMFIDEVTMKTLLSDGHVPDRMGFIGFWKLVVVKNLPYDDMRRVGKIPKLLPHRLFPSARYTIWLDSKLRLQLDPLLILEYFLWRKGYEFAISNHYDRHCVWEEVAQNKRLNKFNHSVIDQQFAFYQADGLKRFNASDPHKLLPSNVPEGSFIIRAHTPMSNLFSCLWFNEVDRFTPRDQLSFAYTYQKLRRTNPDKPFHLNMFKDCERRHIAKLFRHRLDERHRQRATG